MSARLRDARGRFRKRWTFCNVDLEDATREEVAWLFTELLSAEIRKRMKAERDRDILIEALARRRASLDGQR